MKKRKNAIKLRGTNKTTKYYAAGKRIKIKDIGEFPRLLERMLCHEDEIEDWKENSVFSVLKLAAITADFVYYCDEEEGDPNGGIAMLNRRMKLVSANIFAHNDLAEMLQKNEGLLWMSKAIRYWQREEFIRPEKITPEIRKFLKEVNLDDLTEEEQRIYLAFRQNGPVKYTKAESLMAVLSNDLDPEEYSDQLTAIATMLEDHAR